MEYDNLTLDSSLTVLGIIFHGWNPTLRSYGPMGSCTVGIKTIITLLNNDINVVLSDDQNQALYFFVKQYNDLLDFSKSNKPRATKAEEVLYSRLYGKALIQEQLENEENPFIDTNDTIDIAAETISLTPHTIKGNGLDDPLKGIRQKIKRTRAYDVFAATPSTNSPYNDSIERVNEMVQYGDIDFDLE